MSGHEVKPAEIAGTPAAEPFYARMARDLSDGIARGEPPVGSLLPTEIELCRRFGASRHTVRAALKELQDQGLVTRRKKVGTRVEAAAPAPLAFRPFLSSIDDLTQFGETHRRVVRDIVEIVPDRALAKLLGSPPGRTWLRVTSLRLDAADGGCPIGLTDVFVDPAYAGLRDEIRARPDMLISSLIEARHGRRIAEIRQDISAILVPDDAAGVLQVEAGSAGLRIVRRYLDAAGSCFEVSISLHPSERFTVSTRLLRT